MSILINDALAAATTTTAGASNEGGMSSIIFLVAFALVFYLILIRPQSKRAKEQRNLIANLAKGDEVLTSGGILGRVVAVEDNFIMVNIAQGVDIKVQKMAVVALVPKGTINAA